MKESQIKEWNISVICYPINNVKTIITELVFEVGHIFDFQLYFALPAFQLQLIGREPRSSCYGGDSCSEGCGFDSKHRILDWHFFTHICGNVCWKRLQTENLNYWFLMKNISKGCFNVVVLEALTQQCGSIPVRFDTLKSNLNKLYYASAKCLLQ